MSTERIEKIRADEVCVGDRIKAPDARTFYELTVAKHKPGLDPDEDRVELGTGWGSVTLEPGEVVERENWQTGDAAAEIEGAMRSRLDDIAALTKAADYEDPGNVLAEVEAKRLEALGFERKGDPLDEQAQRLIDEFPLCVETTISFEIVLGTGGPDDRLVFECNVYEDSRVTGDGSVVHQTYEISRVLYRYSWTGSAERVLSGDDLAAAEALGRRVVPELVE